MLCDISNISRALAGKLGGEPKTPASFHRCFNTFPMRLSGFLLAISAGLSAVAAMPASQQAIPNEYVVLLAEGASLSQHLAWVSGVISQSAVSARDASFAVRDVLEGDASALDCQ